MGRLVELTLFGSESEHSRRLNHRQLHIFEGLFGLESPQVLFADCHFCWFLFFFLVFWMIEGAVAFLVPRTDQESALFEVLLGIEEGFLEKVTRADHFIIDFTIARYLSTLPNREQYTNNGSIFVRLIFDYISVRAHDRLGVRLQLLEQSLQQ